MVESDTQTVHLRLGQTNTRDDIQYSPFLKLIMLEKIKLLSTVVLAWNFQCRKSFDFIWFYGV
jgi:hypothetical protein